MANKQEYRNLTKVEKIKEINDTLISSAERNAYNLYLTALENEDIETINYFESFGDRPFQFILNYRVYNQNLLFGFDDKNLNENGRIERVVFLEKEDILIYAHKNGWKELNKIQIAKGKNGKWTNGLYTNTNTGGYAGGCSVWDDIFENKDLAIIDACKKMIKYHTEHSWNASNKVIFEANELIQKVLGNRPVQLSFF